MSELTPHPEIVPLARAFGAVPEGVGFTVGSGRARIQVFLEINSGTVMGLSFHARPGPLPQMRLRTEVPLDGTAKRVGINVEVQTGDAEFDRRVYIESDAPADAVRTALASPDARAEVLSLLESFEDLQFDFEGIHLKAMGDVDVERAKRAVAGLTRIAATLPRFHESALQARRYPLLGVVLVLSAIDVIPIAAVIVGHLQYPAVHDLAPVLVGLGAGAASWIVAAALVFLRLRGRSTSLRDIVVTCALLFPICAMGGLAAVYWINGLADGSRATTRKVRVVACAEDSEDHKGSVTVAWGKGETVDIARSSCSGVVAGTMLRVTTHAGALGFPWVASIE
jgi:hypothetical protein